MSDVGPAAEQLGAGEKDKVEPSNPIRMTAVSLLSHHQVTPPATPPPDAMSSAGAIENMLSRHAEGAGDGNRPEIAVTTGGEAIASQAMNSDAQRPSSPENQARGAKSVSTRDPEHEQRQEEGEGTEHDQRDEGQPAQGALGTVGAGRTYGVKEGSTGVATGSQPSPGRAIVVAHSSGNNTPTLSRLSQPSPLRKSAPRPSYNDVWELLRPLVSTTPQASSPASTSPLVADARPDGVVIPSPDMPTVAQPNISSTAQLNAASNTSSDALSSTQSAAPTYIECNAQSNATSTSRGRPRQVSDSPEPEPAPAPELERAPAQVEPPTDNTDTTLETDLSLADLPTEPPPPSISIPQRVVQPINNTGLERIPAPVRPAIRYLRNLLDERELLALMEQGSWETLLVTNFARIMEAWRLDLDATRAAGSWPSAPTDNTTKEQEYRNFVTYCQVRYPSQLAAALRPTSTALSRRVTDPHPAVLTTAPPAATAFSFGNATPAGRNDTHSSPAQPSPIQRPTSQPLGPPLAPNASASPGVGSSSFQQLRPSMATNPFHPPDASPQGAAQWISAPPFGTGFSQGRLVQPGQLNQPGANWFVPPNHTVNQQMMMVRPSVPNALLPIPAYPQAPPSASVGNSNLQGQAPGNAGNVVGQPVAIIRTPAEQAWDRKLTEVSASLQTAWDTVLRGQGEFANTMKETIVRLEQRVAKEEHRSEHYKQKAVALEAKVTAIRQQADSAEAKLVMAQAENSKHKQRWSQMVSVDSATRSELDNLKAELDGLVAANRDANNDKERLQVENERLYAEREKSRAGGGDESDAQRLAEVVAHSKVQLDEAIAHEKEVHADEVKQLKDLHAAQMRSNNLKMAALEKAKADEITRIRLAQETEIKETVSKGENRLRSLEKANAHLKEELRAAQAALAGTAAAKAHAAREATWIRQKEDLEAKIATLSMDIVGLENRLGTLQTGFERISEELEQAKQAVQAKEAELAASEESSAALIEDTESNAKEQYEALKEKYERLADEAKSLEANLTKAATSEATLRQSEAELLAKVASLERERGRIADKEKEVADLKSQLETAEKENAESKAKEGALVGEKKAREMETQRLQQEISDLQRQLEMADAAVLDGKTKERVPAKERKALEEEKQLLEKEVKRLGPAKTQGAKSGTAPPFSSSSAEISRKHAVVNGPDATPGTRSSASPNPGASSRPLARAFVAPSPVPGGSAGPSRKRERSPVKPTTKDNEPLFMPGSQSLSPVLKKAKLEPNATPSVAGSPTPAREPVSFEWIRQHISLEIKEVLDKDDKPVKVVCKICHVDAKKPIKKRLALQGKSKKDQEDSAAVALGPVEHQAGLPGVRSWKLDEDKIIRHLDENHQSTLVRLKAQRDRDGKRPTDPASFGAESAGKEG